MTTTFAFIDAQNLHNGINSDFEYWAGKGKKRYYKGWKLDMKKFYSYLKTRHKVDQAILFMGDDPRHIKMRDKFISFGYQIVLKPHIKTKNGKIKGNCDAELVLHACKIEFNNYDKAIIVSGDGDFLCLVTNLIDDNKLKLLFVPNEKRYSSLYKNIDKRYMLFLNRFKTMLEIK